MIDVDNSSNFSIDEVSVKNYTKQMLQILKVNTKSDVSILFVNEDEMTKQHVRWMNESGPTDVMSFPMDDIVLQDSKLRKKQAILGHGIVNPSSRKNQPIVTTKSGYHNHQSNDDGSCISKDRIGCCHCYTIFIYRRNLFQRKHCGVHNIGSNIN
jgi:ssRNA-specific RNase YbeY (16S rRNA maturation enzyme)